MKVFIKLTVALGLAVGISLPSLAGTVEAKKNGTKVLSGAKKGAAVIKTLKKGDQIESGERKGMYWQVKVDGKDGFVSIMKVKRVAVSDSGLSDAMRTASQNGRQSDDVSNTRSRSAVMGVRGLDESDDTSFAGNAKPNFRMVYAMEDRETSDKSVEKLGDLVFNEIEKRMQ